MTTIDDVRRVQVLRDPDGEENDEEPVAVGCELPSGAVVIEWDPTAFPEGERTEEPSQSIYGSLDDASQATGGDVFVELDGGEQA